MIRGLVFAAAFIATSAHAADTFGDRDAVVATLGYTAAYLQKCEPVTGPVPLGGLYAIREAAKVVGIDLDQPATVRRIERVAAESLRAMDEVGLRRWCRTYLKAVRDAIEE